ncbi:glycosyl hydrolase family 115 (putative glucuronidase) [Pseudoduganella lurida]|uniref:Glycosyl hydrolase family 115 (Putative glucuronidase) n=1 Tax=Pseudoduganella lurida TaxID=1036180 RepID=A0A562REG7_9BURK|nr:glycosyl hydrolase 115 family protein [Pseudoduganella lurida]TWI67418.1 glycosyl hydrolase family 115 (putative glucuronidase) [Pseudoduganella lurida]
MHNSTRRPQRRWRSLALGLLLSAGAMSGALAIGRAPIVVADQPGADGLTLFRAGYSATLQVDAGESAGVARAARDLQKDLERVGASGVQLKRDAAVQGGDVVLIGTLGQGGAIDRLAAAGKIDVASLRGKWEGYLIQVVEDPLPGVQRALVIAGSDRRGTTFGIYELSEQVGVSPWYWWADVPTVKRNAIVVPAGTRVTDAPVVQYRGIFLNDEAPALSNWAKERFGGLNHEFYEHVFELMLRMKANYLWPAMWNNAFYDDDPQNGKLASEMGIIMGTSHHEPMMRAQQEWQRHGKGAWDYQKNAATLERFWAGGLRNTRSYDKVITLAMRGDGDEPMSDDTNVALLEKIVARQRALIRQELGVAPDQVPQLWALYKEVQDYYEQGMKVPDDVLLLWCDDNWGNIRRLPTPQERKRVGGAGIYYHFDYVGGPRSYKWLNVTQIAKVWEQMHLAHGYGANRLWIVNVGDLKPMEVPTEFFLTYAWNPDAWPAERLPAYLRGWAAREFGATHAADIADIVNLYTRYNARRRPEQLEPGTYSHHYNEAERVVADYNALAVRAQGIADQLPAEAKDAYFQLVLYPVRAAAAANDMYYAAYRNRLYAAQGRVTTNDMAQRVREQFDLNLALARQYHQDVAGGKWNHMMSQTKFGYTGWDQPFRDVVPAVSQIHIPAPSAAGGVQPASQMGVAVEGSEIAWPKFGMKPLTLPALDGYEKKARYVEVFNRSAEPFDVTVTADQPWVKLAQRGGRVEKDLRIPVDIDWARAPAGTSSAQLTIAGPRGAKVNVAVPVSNRRSPGGPLVGHVETGGVVAIEAAHYTRAVAPAGRRWLEIPDYGATLSGMTTLPAAAAALEVRDGMRLEYQVNLVKPGTVTVQAILAPTLKFQPGEGFRYAISFDDEAPQVVNVHRDASAQHWETIVSDGVAKFATTHTLGGKGPHVLKFWALDPGLVLQKLVVDNGGLQPSYLGPPESPYAGVRR